MFSIIIPTYNRLNNIKEVIKSIKAQVDPPEYEIIIADDGSTDHTGQYINSLDDPNIKYVWCGPNQGFRPNRTRNIGITHAKYPYIILVDSDVILNPNALKEHAKIREDQRFINVVVIGMYHFMDEVDRTSLDVTNWESVAKYVPDKISESPPLAGLDCRIHAFHKDLETIPIITEYDGLGFFGGNQCWPTWMFWALGGYDEKMPSGMGEDAELGQRMRLNNVPVIQYEPVYGVHLWHQRNVRDSMRMVQESIAYIDKKYGIGNQIGVIAQEIQQVFPELIVEIGDGYLGVDYPHLTGVLVQAIKEQQETINGLKSQIDKQQIQIDDILKKLKEWQKI